jgi:hypothetical protein
MAKTNSTQSAREKPIVMRWTESLPAGNRSWYLASLKPDLQFWGYVHIRTDELAENRSFVGQLDELKYTQICNLLDGIKPRISDSDGADWDGVIGLGTRSKFTTLIRFRSGLNQLPNSNAFLEIVSVLHPEFMIASDLIAG